ncbi:MAG: D-serine ammonia-lyase [Acidaminobacteraceae bacterium]
MSTTSVKEFISNHSSDSIYQDLTSQIETSFYNPDFSASYSIEIDGPIKYDLIEDASKRLERFANFLKVAFPKTVENDGIIESELLSIDKMKFEMRKTHNFEGKLMLKLDSHLPISGSIKARGGIYEVLKHAETLASEAKLLSITDDYAILASDKFKNFFNNYKIAVGSTGNLGLSIGIISSKLGFKVDVHMSSDAKKWKKDMLRSKGVNVIEYDTDYSIAVKNGRENSKDDPSCHFIDDENSIDLFLGYAVAGRRLKRQIEEKGIIVDHDHPLFVYLPCGVGGGPGGVAYGLKEAFGENVYPIFAEPTRSPCMLLGIYSRLHEGIAVNDIGLDNKTKLDGLAVGRASGFVGQIIEKFVPIFYTITDNTSFRLLKVLANSENVYLEPSALAGMSGVYMLAENKASQSFLKIHELDTKMKNSTHIVWATGGSMVPEDEMRVYCNTSLE